MNYMVFAMFLAFAANNLTPEVKAVSPEVKMMLSEANILTSEAKVLEEKKMAKTVVNKGDNIEVDYEGKLLDGSIFDSSKGRTPLGFTVGAGQMIKGFDDGVAGMKLDEEKIINIKAEDAYGNRDEKMLQFVEKSFFPRDYKLIKGEKVGLKHQSGQTMTAVIGDVTGEKVLLDFNHFLAGKDLIFKVRVVSIK